MTGGAGELAVGVVAARCAWARRCCSCRLRSNGGIVGIDMKAGEPRAAAEADEAGVFVADAEAAVGERVFMCSSSVKRALPPAFVGVVRPPVDAPCSATAAAPAATKPFCRCAAIASSESWLRIGPREPPALAVLRRWSSNPNAGFCCQAGAAACCC